MGHIPLVHPPPPPQVVKALEALRPGEGGRRSTADLALRVELVERRIAPDKQRQTQAAAQGGFVNLMRCSQLSYGMPDE